MTASRRHELARSKAIRAVYELDAAGTTVTFESAARHPPRSRPASLRSTESCPSITIGPCWPRPSAVTRTRRRRCRRRVRPGQGTAW